MVRRGPGLVLPAILVAVGVVALLGNLGLISTDDLGRLVDLWPLILVVLGIELVLRGTTSPEVAGRVGIIVVAVAAVAAVVYATLAPAQLAGEHTADYSAPAGALQQARMSLDFGGADISIGLGQPGGPDLYTAHVTYGSGEQPSANFDEAAGAVTIAIHQAGLTFGNHRRIDVALNPGVTWTLQLSGGAANASINLSGGHLAGIGVSGGASRVTLVAPAPSGTVPMTFDGGANTVTVHRPAASPARVDVSGGASSLQADGRSQAGLGELTWQSDGYASATDRFAITVSGGANRVVVDTAG